MNTTPAQNTPTLVEQVDSSFHNMAALHQELHIAEPGSPHSSLLNEAYIKETAGFTTLWEQYANTADKKIVAAKSTALMQSDFGKTLFERLGHMSSELEHIAETGINMAHGMTPPWDKSSWVEKTKGTLAKTKQTMKENVTEGGWGIVQLLRYSGLTTGGMMAVSGLASGINALTMKTDAVPTLATDAKPEVKEQEIAKLRAQRKQLLFSSATQIIVGGSMLAASLLIKGPQTSPSTLVVEHRGL